MNDILNFIGRRSESKTKTNVNSEHFWYPGHVWKIMGQCVQTTYSLFRWRLTDSYATMYRRGHFFVRASKLALFNNFCEWMRFVNLFLQLDFCVQKKNPCSCDWINLDIFCLKTLQLFHGMAFGLSLKARPSSLNEPYLQLFQQPLHHRYEIKDYSSSSCGRAIKM